MRLRRYFPSIEHFRHSAHRRTGVNWRKLRTMEDDQTPPPEKPAATDWADLRAQAAKLGISLSELQQQQRERKARLARKFSYKPPVDKAKE